MVCVYRRSNAPVVGRLVEQVTAVGGQSRLWALDSVDPTLQDRTLGCGPGGRFELINRLLEGLGSSHTVVVADDDVSFSVGSLDQLIRISQECAFELAQPAHTLRSHSTYAFCRRRPWSRARRTNFIEIGPLFVVDAAAMSRFTPFPEDTRMGWGVDLLWRDAALGGACIGIVDAVAVSHHTPLGHSYDMTHEGKLLGAMLRERHLSRVEDGQKTMAMWYRWRPRPPWR